MRKFTGLIRDSKGDLRRVVVHPGNFLDAVQAVILLLEPGERIISLEEERA